jgi:2-dehydro-3-deoxyphosphogluconate aldolase/(4S)-4-hydroxy-2-oxoglutarate aldolase
MNVIERITTSKVIAIIRGDYTQQAVRVMASTLYETGVQALEVTMNSSGALTLVAMLAAEFGDRMLIGAGTVTAPDQVKAVAQAGGRFIVSPETYAPVIIAAEALGMEPIPGAYTPTEIMAAWRLGARLIKVFPASVGGPDYIKAIRAPLSQVAMVATGGIEIADVSAYLAAGAAAVGMGGALIPGQFDGSAKAVALLNARGQALRAQVTTKM